MKEAKLCAEKTVWDEKVLKAGGHPLQLWGWGEIKSRGSWAIERLIIHDGPDEIGYCQVLYRALPWPLNKMAYVPRGPVALENKREEVLRAVAAHAKSRGAISLTVEPDWLDMPLAQGWGISKSPILMARTLVLDLSLSEDELLECMTKKTRQYIRKSEKAGIEIKKASTLGDVAECLAIYKQTAARAGFALHSDSYYEGIFTEMGEHSQLLMATYQGRVVAFLWLAVSEEVAFELYGGMNDEGQELRANYHLKWSAIRQMKEWGIRRYDMNGLLNDGVSKFKQGFADHETLLAGTYDVSLSPLAALWLTGLPLARKLVRLLKK